MICIGLSIVRLFNFQRTSSEEIRGGKTIKESANVFKNILSGKGTKSQQNVVVANSSLAIKTITGKKIDECVSIANESIKSGNAYKSLINLIGA